MVRHQLNYINGHYLIDVEMLIQGEHSAVYAILTDYNFLTSLNDTITQSKLISSNGNQHIVNLETEACFWVICTSLLQRQTITELEDGYLMSITDPEHSDFSYGHVLWQIKDEGNYTRVHYRGDFVPDFGLPPFTGPGYVTGKMFDETKKTINGIEARIQRQLR